MVSDDDINSLSLAEALAVLQKLKAVSPALARLVQDAVGSEIQARVATGGEARHGKDKEWPELTAEEQAAAATLGFTQAGWEAGDEPLVCTIAWAGLPEAVRAAAQVLGYEQSSWDCELETTPEDATPAAASLSPAEPAIVPPPPAAAAAQPPAPPEQKFGFGDNVVAGKDKDWAGLTNAERISATNLGFDQAMWDAGGSSDACAIPFARLNTTFKISAQALGYTQATWDAELPEADEPPQQQTLPAQPHTPPPPAQPAQRQPQASPGQSYPPLGAAPAAAAAAPPAPAPPAVHEFPALGGGAAPGGGRSRPQTAPQRLAPAPQPSPAHGGADGWETVGSSPRCNVARSGLGASIGAASTRAGDGNQLNAASQENNRFSSGYIFGCKPETYDENMSRQLFGVTKQHMRDIQNITPSSALFLFNYSTKMLHGVFVPNGPGGLNIEPEAWKTHAAAGKIAPRNRAESGSPYPAQIRFNVLKKCEPLHYRVWGHIPTPKPQGFNQFELHLDADQASKLAALLMNGR